MKTHIVSDNKNIYVSVKLIDGRPGFFTMSNFAETTIEKTNTLVFSRIRSIEFVNDIMNPVFSGTIIYEDDQFEMMMNTHGNINLFCNVNIRITSSELSENVGPVDDIIFSHDFYVDSIELLDKSDDICVYKLNIISMLFFNFMENKPISTFNGSIIKNEQAKQTALTLIKYMFGKNIKLNPLSLLEDRSSPITYISATNETVLETLSKILHYNMVLPTSDLMLVPYDHMENYYDIWFKSKFDTEMINTQNVSMSKYGNVATIIVESIPGYDLFGNQVVKMSTKNHIGNHKMIDATKESIIHEFDFDINKFYKYGFTKDIKERSFGSTRISTEFKNRMSSDFSWFTMYPDMKLETSPYNDVQTAYYFQSALDGLTKNGSLIINIPGNIYRKPGIDMYINVDSSSKDYSSALQFQGRWLVTKVRHIFDMKKENYSNTLMLGRFEIPIDAKEFRESL